MSSKQRSRPLRAGDRLHKILAAAGIDSRRKCEEYVRAGRVTVDGEVITNLAARVEPDARDVRVDGERIKPQPKRYYLLNKPAGVVCTHRDPRGRPRAVDLVPAGHARLFTVGRLDESSEGLLIVTNDGDLAQQLAHPRFQVPRTYRVQVAGTPTTATLAELRRGLHFADGRFHLKRARRLRTHGKSAFLEVELTQGRNREIRRLFARVGHKVLSLRRVAFGSLRLGDLAPGRYRPLSSREIGALKSLAAQSPRTGQRRIGRKTRSSRAGRSLTKRRAGPHRPAGRKTPARRMLDLTQSEAARNPE